MKIAWEPFTDGTQHLSALGWTFRVYKDELNFWQAQRMDVDGKHWRNMGEYQNSSKAAKGVVKDWLLIKAGAFLRENM